MYMKIKSNRSEYFWRLKRPTINITRKYINP